MYLCVYVILMVVGIYTCTYMYRLIDKQDGVRLLWSLLKSPNTEVH